MKKLIFLFSFFVLSASSYSQTSEYNLKSQNLDKRVVKTITHTYLYHQKSGGFIKSSVSTNSYNNEGHLTEVYYSYNSTYSGTNSVTSTLYNYNSKGQLISTQDISPVKSKYSSYYRFYYDNNGNLTKREIHYNDGAVAFTNYTYDSKDRLLKKDVFSSSRKLTGSTVYRYDGRKRTEIYTSYSSSTGEVIGTYTTYYKNDMSTRYTSKSKYSASDITYKYDKHDNLIASINKNNSKNNTTYEYKYDNRDNWIVKHYKSGSYHSFYFREIYFKNGKKTGSTNFDSDYVNRHGNFNNVAVVPIVPTKKTTTTNTTTTTNNYNSNMPSFTSKNWVFNYVNLSKKVSSLSGEVTLRVTNGSNLSANNTVKINYSFGGKNYGDTYTVSSYSHIKNYHFWSLKSSTKNTKVSLSIYDERQYIKAKDLYLKGILMITNEGKNSSFYLE